jgi:eukaryotic-like serine/threonine-protein kinase
MNASKTLEVPGYQVMQYLGSGARSTIWQIRDRETGELYTLKRVVKREGADVRFLEQGLNEYSVASQLDHPSLRRVFRLRRIKRWLSLREIHLVMEYCPGKSIQEQRPESVAEVVRIFIEVGKALSYMNSRSFVHADMKPNNIIIADDGLVKIIDMGQSCAVGTVKQRIQGTPDFIAPEQVHRRPLDGRTDVFNFGAALYWTLTGKPIPTILPKKGSVTMLADMTVVPPEQLNPEVPAPLSKLIGDCIEAQPSQRIGSMNEVVSRLGLIGHTLNRGDEPVPEIEVDPESDEIDYDDSQESRGAEIDSADIEAEGDAQSLAPLPPEALTPDSAEDADSPVLTDEDVADELMEHRLADEAMDEDFAAGMSDDDSPADDDLDDQKE